MLVILNFYYRDFRSAGHGIAWLSPPMGLGACKGVLPSRLSAHLDEGDKSPSSVRAQGLAPLERLTGKSQHNVAGVSIVDLADRVPPVSLPALS